MKRRPFRLERGKDGFIRAVDFESPNLNNFHEIEFGEYFKAEPDPMNDLFKFKQTVDLDRVCLIPHSGIHPIKEQTKEEKRKEFERGTFNEI